MDKVKIKVKPNLISKQHVIVIAIMLFFTVLAINFNNSLHSKTLARKDILIATVQQGDIDVTIDGYGSLKSANLQLLTSLTKATVKKILLKPGALVTKDSVIVLLENPELAQLVEDAQQKLAQQQANYRQQKLNQQRELLNENANLAELNAQFQTAKLKRSAQQKLIVDGIVSQLSYQQTRLNEQQLQQRISIAQQRIKQLALVHKEALNIQQQRINQQRGQLNIAQKRFNRLTVKAGFNGVLQRLSIELGQSLNAGQEVALIGSVSDLIALIKVPQTQAQQVTLNQQVIIDTRQDKIIGKVVRIDPIVKDNTVTVEISLPKHLPKSARPQQNIDAQIITKTLKNIRYIQRPGNVKAQSNVVLFKLNKNLNQAIKTKLRLGEKTGRYIEITQGAEVEDTFIISDLSNYKVNQLTIN